MKIEREVLGKDYIYKKKDDMKNKKLNDHQNVSALIRSLKTKVK